MWKAPVLLLGLASFTAVSASPFGLGERADPSYPTCAANCITNTSTDSCTASNYTCLCNDQKWLAATTQCFSSQCTGADVVAAYSIQHAVCQALGVADTFTLVGTPTVSSSSTTPTTGPPVTTTGVSTKPASTTTTESPPKSTTTTSGSPSTTTKNAAAQRVGSSGAGAVAIGAAVLGALVF